MAKASKLKVSDYEEISEFKGPARLVKTPLVINTDPESEIMIIKTTGQEIILDYDDGLALYNAIGRSLDILKELLDNKMPKKTKKNTVHFGLTDLIKVETGILVGRKKGKSDDKQS